MSKDKADNVGGTNTMELIIRDIGTIDFEVPGKVEDVPDKACTPLPKREREKNECIQVITQPDHEAPYAGDLQGCGFQLQQQLRRLRAFTALCKVPQGAVLQHGVSEETLEDPQA